MEAGMKFIACSQPAHKDYGVNSPVNLGSLRVVYPRQDRNRPEAEQDAEARGTLIVFSIIGQGCGIRWSFADGASRDAEVSRIDSIVI